MDFQNYKIYRVECITNNTGEGGFKVGEHYELIEPEGLSTYLVVDFERGKFEEVIYDRIDDCYLIAEGNSNYALKDLVFA